MERKTVLAGPIKAIIAMHGDSPAYVVEAWIDETGEPLSFSDMSTDTYMALMAAT